MKKFFGGVIVGALFFSITTVLAATWNVVPSPFSIYVDGTQAEVESLNVNNSTYVHIRDLAEVIGCDVDFNEEEEEIYIRTKKNEVATNKNNDFTLEEAKESFKKHYPKATIKIDKKQGDTFYIEGTADDCVYKMKFASNGEIITNETISKK